MNILPDDANKILPLVVEGLGLDDFCEASLKHRSKFAEVTRHNHHPESLRDAKPLFIKSRQQPPEKFVKSHKRFLYVSGLPHYVAEGNQLGDYQNPVHRMEVTKSILAMLNVSSESIHPANMTSAFVGYKNKDEYDLDVFLLTKAKYANTIEHPQKIHMYQYVHEDDKLSDDYMKNIPAIRVEGIPASMSTARLAHCLFPSDAIEGIQLPLKNIKRLDAITILVPLESKDQVDSVLTSALIKEHMDTSLGKSTVHFFQARRELVYGGITGTKKGQACMKQGNRLVVDGDKPSKDFFQSHAGVIQLRNLDFSLTKEDITDFFQPFSSLRRDVHGSIEFVTCLHKKERTDKAFVGFDRLSEAEAVLKSGSGLLKNLGEKGRSVKVRLVKELFHPLATKSNHTSTRPARSEEELLDSLNNWEQYINPKDITELELMGISKDFFADAFRTMRFKNKSYGAYDWGMQDEKFNPQKSSGQEIKEMMQLYVDTVKELVKEEAEVPFHIEMTYPHEYDNDEENTITTGEKLIAHDQERVQSNINQRRSYFFDT